MRSLILVALLGGCTLNVDYTGTYYQCNPDGTCPPGFECQDMVCVPTDPAPPACSLDVAAGSMHSCAVREDGTVWCWGRNDKGELGDGTAADSDEPIQVAGVVNATAVGAGDEFSCALDKAGAVWCWGVNTYGQLGDSTTGDSRTPVQVTALSGATQLSVGAAHACALQGSGAVVCWGSNAHGQLGDGSFTARSSQTAVGTLGPAKVISAGNEITCAALMDGTAWCWGENNDGELGSGTVSMMGVNRPGQVMLPSGTKIAKIATGNDFACAATEGGGVFCWGDNANGQLGNNSAVMNSPRPVPALTPNAIVALEAGEQHICALDFFNNLWCWGYGANGRLTDGSGASRSTPVLSKLLDVVAFSAGGDHTCAVDRAGAVRCGGFNRRGALGDGRQVTRGEPHQVANVSDAVSIAAGGSHTCAALANGALTCWGENDDGEVGDGSFVERTVASPVNGFDSYKAMGLGSNHTCALNKTGDVLCWGANDDNQLGDSSGASSSTPRPTQPLVGMVTAISVGDATTCATVGSEVKCWGRFFGGTAQSLGAGLSADAGYAHWCKLETDRTPTCEGANYRGQLGNGNTTTSGGPNKPVNVTNVAELYVSGDASCARIMDGMVKCWGYNEEGQLGIGNLSYAVSTPTLVMGLTSVAQMSLGGNSSCARKMDGTVWCWGAGYYGGVGDNTYQTRTSPVQVLSLSSVMELASGGAHQCALKQDGTVWCWGLDDSGQLGDGIHSIITPVGVRMTCPAD